MNSKLCLIYNFAPKYREGIFQLIDQTYDCDWYFGKNSTDIKGLDLAALRYAKEIPSNKVIGNWYWQKGVIGLLGKYDTFFMLGELYCLSTWVTAILAKLCPKKKVYFWSHGWYGRETFAKKVMKKIFFRLANATFLYGNYARKLMIENDFDGNKLFVVHNSLNYDAQLELRNEIEPSDIYTQHFGNKNKTLIFIGRLIESKRLDMLIQAVAKLKQEGKQYNIVLVGDGAIKESLQKLASDLGIIIWLYGACYNERTNAELIYNADLCVSPGNIGLTAIHAMMFGTPVITHNSFPYQGPEFEAIKAGETGDFFTRGDVKSLAQAIERWFGTHGNDRNAVRQACYNEIDTQWTPKFQIEIIKRNLNLV